MSYQDAFYDASAAGLDMAQGKNVDFSKILKDKDAFDIGDLITVDVFKVAYLISNDEPLPVGTRVRATTVGTYFDRDTFKAVTVFGVVEGGAYDGQSARIEYESPIAETTTSGDLAFVPTVVGGNVDGQQDAEDIADNDVGPLEILKKRKKKGINEDVDRKVDETKRKVIEELDDIVFNSKINATEFINVFPVKNDITASSVLITPFTVKSADKKIYGLLPDDVGDLELILSALESGGEVAQYDAFKDVAALYGARVSSVVNGVTVIYEGNVEYKGIESESVMVSDQDVLDEVENRFSGVKVVNKVLYPASGVFSKGFMKKLKTIIDEAGDEKENDDE